MRSLPDSPDEPLLPVEKLVHAGPAVKVGRFNCPADHDCFRHTAQLNNHLLVVTTQPVLWRRAEGEYCYAEAGAALLHRRGGEIWRQACTRAGDVSLWFGIREDLFREALDRCRLDFEATTEAPLSVLTGPALRLSVLELASRIETGEADDLEIEEKVLGFIEQACQDLARCQPDSRSRPAHRELANRARKSLDQSYLQTDQGSGSLEQLATALGVSMFHLCRVFRQQTGMTLHAYRQRQRLGRAVERLRRSRHDLTELALDLGFSSHSHFSRTFREYLGISPSRLNTARHA